METYQAKAVREGAWWVINVDGVGGAQVRSTEEAQRTATEVVALVKGIPLDGVDVEVEFQVPGPLGEEVELARRETKKAEQALRSAVEQTRSAVACILQNGMSTQDAARILGVSPQHISQLVNPSLAAGMTALFAS